MCPQALLPRLAQTGFTAAPKIPIFLVTTDNDLDDDGGGKENEEAAAEGPEARLMRARWPERKEAVRAVQQFATSQGKQAKVTKVNGGSSI